MKIALALVLVIVTLAPSAAAAPVASDDVCLGRWQGRGKNTGSDDYWTIDLNLTANPDGGNCGTIEYLNPKCGGFLDSCEKRGEEIHTKERYTHRAADCAPAGKVIIRCDGDKLHYSWIGWEKVDSVLTRVDPPTPVPSEEPRTKKEKKKKKKKKRKSRRSTDDDDDDDDDDKAEPKKSGCLPSCTVSREGPESALAALGLLALFAVRRRRSAIVKECASSTKRPRCAAGTTREKPTG